MAARRQPLLVVTINDQTTAYPLAILVWHEIVNDVVGGEPVVVSYCPLCNTGIVFERTVDVRCSTSARLAACDCLTGDVRPQHER